MDVHYTIMNTTIPNSFCTRKWRCRMMWLVWWGFITTTPVFNFLIMIPAKHYGTWITQFIDPWPWTRRNRLLLSKQCHFLRCLFSFVGFHFYMHLWLSALWTAKRCSIGSKLKLATVCRLPWNCTHAQTVKLQESFLKPGEENQIHRGVFSDRSLVQKLSNLKSVHMRSNNKLRYRNS